MPLGGNTGLRSPGAACGTAGFKVILQPEDCVTGVLLSLKTGLIKNRKKNLKN